MSHSKKEVEQQNVMAPEINAAIEQAHQTISGYDGVSYVLMAMKQAPGEEDGYITSMRSGATAHHLLIMIDTIVSTLIEDGVSAPLIASQLMAIGIRCAVEEDSSEKSSAIA